MTILYKLLIVLIACGAVVHANLHEYMRNNFPKYCQEDCKNLCTSVSGCVENVNQNYSVSVNPSVPESYQTQGEPNQLASCFCNPEAIQASGSCLKCLSQVFCLEPEVTMQDYAGVCQDFQTNGQNLLYRYFPNLKE